VLGATIGQGKSGPLPIHLPPGEGRRLHEWLTACGFTFISAYMTVVEPAYHETVNLGELAFTISPAQHSLPAAILTLTAGGKRLVYTGDTGDCPPLWKAMEGADLVLAEVAGLPPAQAAEKGHLPAALLGRMARAAGVRELVLTHFMHGSDPEALAEEVAAAFGRPVHLAHEDRIFEV
ncbi:MAG: MBL fold metallo-hydrolase, partial [Bacteroidota bacterium]